MSIKNILMMAIMVPLLTGIPLVAQQAIGGGTNNNAPEIHDDQTVTFLLEAPGAKEVKLTGDWMPPYGWVPGSVEMVWDEKGIWKYTTEPLEPELYGYAFLVDGLRVIDPNNVFVSRDIATLSNIFLIDGDRSDLYRVSDVPHGTLARRWYESPGLGMDRRITIYTPPGYETTDTNYPVLYLLHGAGGDEEAWIENGRVAQIMDNLIARGLAEPMIVVMPNGNVIQDAAPGKGEKGYYKPTFMVPRTMDGTYEQSFPEIILFVEQNYRIKTDKAHRAIAGLSMGGYHSMHISRFYPELFNYVGLFSAALLPSQNTTAEIYQNIDETLSKQMQNGYELYWIGIGRDDFLFRNNLEFKKKLDDMGMPSTFRESDGGHVWKNWRLYLSEFVPQLFR